MNIVTKKRKLSKCFAAIAVSAAAGGGIYVDNLEAHSVSDFTVTGGSEISFGIGGDFDKVQRQPLTIVGESSVNDKLDANNSLNMV